MMPLLPVTIPLLDRIESRFNPVSVTRWMDGYWHWSIYVSALYVVVVFTGRRLMRDKQAFNLRTVLTMWNTGLAMFSLLGAATFAPDRIGILFTEGLAKSVCVTRIFDDPQCYLWAWLFSLSKIFELGDTFFIVLRKSSLSFLHWYHHVTVLVYAWYAMHVPVTVAMWSAFLNFSVHTVMYSYYAMKASGRFVPSWIAQFITVLQIAQMFVALALNVLAYWFYHSDVDCNYDDSMFIIGMVIYTSYSILFVNFFYKRYFARRQKTV